MNHAANTGSGLALPRGWIDGDAGADRTLADHQLAAARDQRGVADFDAGDVSDGVERARRPANRQLEIPLSRLLRLEPGERMNKTMAAMDVRMFDLGAAIFIGSPSFVNVPRSMVSYGATGCNRRRS